MRSSCLTPYHLSFTAASLRPELGRIVAECYLVEQNWEATRNRILADNALQCRSPSSAVRLEREFRQRLMTLTRAQIALLAQSTAPDRALISWLAAVKHSSFLFDFASESLSSKIENGDPVLRLSDYRRFTEAKISSHPELEAVSPATAEKVRTVTLRMLNEAGILHSGEGLGLITRPVLTPEVEKSIREDDLRWLAAFLVPESEILV